MKKNQKYNKENIFPIIAAWQQSKQPQAKFCKDNQLSISTFQYWLKKYKESQSETQTQKKPEEQRKGKSFLTVKLAEQEQQLPGLSAALADSTEHINIYYPNGVRLSCPTNINPELLCNLINL